MEGVRKNFQLVLVEDAESRRQGKAHVAREAIDRRRKRSIKAVQPLVTTIALGQLICRRSPSLTPHYNVEWQTGTETRQDAKEAICYHSHSDSGTFDQGMQQSRTNLHVTQLANCPQNLRPIRPQTLLGMGRVDPFASYPEELKMKHHKLIDSCKSPHQPSDTLL